MQIEINSREASISNWISQGKIKQISRERLEVVDDDRYKLILGWSPVKCFGCSLLGRQNALKVCTVDVHVLITSNCVRLTLCVVKLVP